MRIFDWVMDFINKEYEIDSDYDSEYENHNEIGKQQIYLINVQNINDGKKAIDYLLCETIVILNFEKVDNYVFQTVMNYIAGATYALEVSLSEISNGVILAVP